MGSFLESAACKEQGPPGLDCAACLQTVDCIRTEGLRTIHSPVADTLRRMLVQAAPKKAALKQELATEG